MSYPRFSSADRQAGTLKKLFSGTAILSLSAVISKTTGLIYKVPLINCVGVSGMAYFLAANHIYVLLFVISTAGLPVAVAVLISEAISKGESHSIGKIYKTALRFFLALGIIGSVCMLLGASKIARMIGIPQAAPSIAAIAPAVFMACISGAVRGYFQGHQIMIHTAVSQVIESAGKLGLGLAGAIYARSCNMDSSIIAAYAIMGTTCGVGLSTVYLIIAKMLFDNRNYKRKSDSNKEHINNYIGRLLKLAFPITIGAAVISFSGVIDTALIPNCLGACGFSDIDANMLYSCYGNMAVPMFSLTPSLIAPIATAVVSLISAAKSSGDIARYNNAVCLSVRMTILLALPASIGLAVFAEPILGLIFGGDISAANVAASLLSVLALSIVPACLITTTNAVLQARGRAGRTIFSMLCGITIKLITEYFLVKSRSVNIYGAPISTVLCDITVIGLNTYFVVSDLHRLKNFYRPVVGNAIAAFAAVGAAVLLWKTTDLSLMSRVAVIAPIMMAALLYAVFALLMGAVDKEMIDIIFSNKIKKREVLHEQTTKNNISVGKAALQCRRS